MLYVVFGLPRLLPAREAGAAGTTKPGSSRQIAVVGKLDGMVPKAGFFRTCKASPSPSNTAGKRDAPL